VNIVGNIFTSFPVGVPSIATFAMHVSVYLPVCPFHRETHKRWSFFQDQHLRPSVLFSCRPYTVWNSITDFTRDPAISTDYFGRVLKASFFARY